MNESFRIGHGYDVHRLANNRRFILGGVEINYIKGLLGHSDADVLVHAIMDALLGAASFDDIGTLFPDTDERYKGISSLSLLQIVNNLLKENGWHIINIDSTIICQKPKIRPYINEMKVTIARILEINTDRVNIKATTEEGLGFTGKNEGVAVHSVCIISNEK